MSGGLHALGMINSIKNNEVLRRRNYNKTKNHLNQKLKDNNLEFKKATKEDMLLVKKAVIAQRKTDFRKSILAFFLSLLILFVLIFVLSQFIVF